MKAKHPFPLIAPDAQQRLSVASDALCQTIPQNTPAWRVQIQANILSNRLAVHWNIRQRVAQAGRF